MKILIFGGNGFLGNEICSLLKRQKTDYCTVSRNNSSSDYKIDISNFKDFDILPNHVFDIVINCATVLPGGNYLDNDYLDKIYRTNILGSQNICKWIDKQNSVRKIINCSTLVVVQKPWSVDINENVNTYPSGNHVLYSSSKLVQELIFSTFANDEKIDLVQLRFSAIYGKNMVWSGIICNFIDQAKNNKLINLNNGNKVSADFLNVIDAAKIVVASTNSDVFGIVNAASGSETYLLELAQVINQNLSENIEIINSNENDFIENRSKINIDKLKKIINVIDFIDLKTGINQLLES
ncbi:MAG: NAD(P)-dependent oxidoreductase [Flavobacterium sp.]|nr:NAD(P)-dependent oxidoreductase [Flavobacterium sp.]